MEVLDSRAKAATSFSSSSSSSSSYASALGGGAKSSPADIEAAAVKMVERIEFADPAITLE